jgi:ATP/maltotriose-dependent transcriptional regulator MalT
VPLANYILQIDNAREVIKQLDELNLFLSSSSDEGQEASYRYHQLFADFLQGNLQQSDPGRMRGLHHRIAEWYQRQDQPVQAVSHYFKADAPENAVGLIDSIARQMYLSGQTRLLEQWYERISGSEELVSQAPELLLNLAKAVGNHGDNLRVIDLLERARAPLLAREDHSSYANLLVTLGVGYIARGYLKKVIRLPWKSRRR